MNLRFERRRRYFVDSRVQGELLRQLVGYWLAGMATVSLILFIYQVAPYWVSGDGRVFQRAWNHLGPILLASATLLPVVLFSAVRFSNRYVGPMLRFRRVIRQLADGEPAARIQLRDGDFWVDVSEDFNDLIERLQPEEPTSRIATTDATDETDENAPSSPPCGWTSQETICEAARSLT